MKHIKFSDVQFEWDSIDLSKQDLAIIIALPLKEALPARINAEEMQVQSKTIMQR